MQAFVQHDAGLNRVEDSILDALVEVPDVGSLFNPCLTILLQYLQDIVMFLVQGSIFLKALITLFPSVTALGELLLCTSRHVINFSGSQVMILNEPEYQSPITMLLSRLKVRPCFQSL